MGASEIFTMRSEYKNSSPAGGEIFSKNPHFVQFLAFFEGYFGSHFGPQNPAKPILTDPLLPLRVTF
jgi:hypothetical protein